MSNHDRNALEQALREFEPVFWVGPWGESLERLYEPDGTFYAVCLDGPVVVATDRRRVTVNKGDLVILPPMVAVELSNSARWFGIVYTGPYPYHFRERFIQVWGFEHLPSRWLAPSSEPVEPVEATNLDRRDLRHRIYAQFHGAGTGDAVMGPEFVLKVMLDPVRPNGFRVDWKSPSEPNEGASGLGSFEAPSPDTIVLEIPTEAFYLTHRLARPPATDAPAMSPEYRPES
jgi:hypothetical protein